MEAPAIQRQIQLPLRKAIQIALRSLRVRLGRSILTLITIAMAIAFLTNVWLTGVATAPLDAAQFAAQGLGGDAPAAAPARSAWLITLSLLVCLVGISNAMLMSVMERFREIGTMKCLGALDSFILKLFLLESLFLGAAGTAAGVLLGCLLTLLLFVKNYGSLVWSHAPWHAVPAIAAASFAIGLAITALAALYPAWRAAKMEPVSAMRVEV